MSHEEDDELASTTVCESESTAFASPASSLNGDSDNEAPPWVKLEDETSLETAYISAQWCLAPSEEPSAMPRSKVVRKHLRSVRGRKAAAC
eukprot:8994179-Heterocapsa_arctica.AAC.1